MALADRLENLQKKTEKLKTIEITATGPLKGEIKKTLYKTSSQCQNACFPDPQTRFRPTRFRLGQKTILPQNQGAKSILHDTVGVQSHIFRASREVLRAYL